MTLVEAVSVGKQSSGRKYSWGGWGKTMLDIFCTLCLHPHLDQRKAFVVLLSLTLGQLMSAIQSRSGLHSPEAFSDPYRVANISQSGHISA